MDDKYTDFTRMNDRYVNLIFMIGVVVSQVIGVAMILMSGFWMGSYQGGYAWTPSNVFNYHPLFMTIGLIFFYGDSILLYRLFKNVTKIYVKILHAVLHGGALIFASISLRAVLDSHNLKVPPIPNLYSLHSWIGLLSFILFGLQWVIGFVAFLFPKLSEGIRRFYLPHHKFWGIAIFGMCCATALMGITEKFLFSVKDYSKLPDQMVLVNFYGVSIVLYGTLIVYLVTKSEYARVEIN